MCSSDLDVVKKTSKKCFVPLTVGGGVRSVEDINKLLNCGADKVSINTAAVQNPEVVVESSKKFGSQCIVVAVDIKLVGTKSWEVFTHGGRKPTGLDAIEWIKKMENLGAGEILLTSMDKDGTKDGYDLSALQSISEWIKIPIIASGGAGKLEHIKDAFQIGNADAALCASIFHFGEYSIKDVKDYLIKNDVVVRT